MSPPCPRHAPAGLPCRLDGFIVLVSLLDFLSEIVPAFGGLTILRILRVLRPLRLLARNEGMKLIITSLFKAMPAVANVFGGAARSQGPLGGAELTHTRSPSRMPPNTWLLCCTPLSPRSCSALA